MGDLTELLQLTGRGDRDAFAALYDATAAKVLDLAVRVSREPVRAEQLTEEAFLEIWRTAPRYDPGERSALAWVVITAHGVTQERTPRGRTA